MAVKDISESSNDQEMQWFFSVVLRLLEVNINLFNSIQSLSNMPHF